MSNQIQKSFYNNYTFLCICHVHVGMVGMKKTVFMYLMYYTGFRHSDDKCTFSEKSFITLHSSKEFVY